jgi:hypothetical protein
MWNWIGTIANIGFNQIRKSYHQTKAAIILIQKETTNYNLLNGTKYLIILTYLTNICTYNKHNPNPNWTTPKVKLINIEQSNILKIDKNIVRYEYKLKTNLTAINKNIKNRSK